MTPVDKIAGELRDMVRDVLRQFQVVEAAVCNGPHAELSVQELRIVEHLGDEGPRMMRELAEFSMLAVNSMTSLVDNLENKGIVRRLRCDEDRRVVRVELTDAGQLAYQAALKEKMQLLRGMLRALTEEEQKILMVLFRKIARAGQSQVQKITSTA